MTSGTTAAGAAWTESTPAGIRRAPGTGAAPGLLGLAVRRHLQLRHRHMVLGSAWNLLQPVATLVVYGLVLSRVLGADGGDLPYATAAWAGVTCWAFLQTGWQQATWAYLHDASLLRKVWLPRHVPPLAPVLAGTVDLGIGLVLLVGVAWAQGLPPTPTLVVLPLAAAVLVAWVGALAVLSAPVAVVVRDLTTVVTVLVRLGFILTPTMYSVDQLPAGWRWTAAVNPVAVVIDAVRDAVAGQWPSFALLAVHAVGGAAALALGLVFARRVGDHIADDL